MSADKGRTFKKVFLRGQVIFRQGDIGEEMYIIETGRIRVSVQIEKKQSIELDIFGPKEFFGEMALFGVHKRSASAVALEDTSVLVINIKTMNDQLNKLPSWFVTMFKTLVERLRITNMKLLPDPLDK